MYNENDPQDKLYFCLFLLGVVEYCVYIAIAITAMKLVF